MALVRGRFTGPIAFTVDDLRCALRKDARASHFRSPRWRARNVEFVDTLAKGVEILEAEPTPALSQTVMSCWKLARVVLDPNPFSRANRAVFVAPSVEHRHV